MQAQLSPQLVILGAGGHGRVVADAARAQGAWGRLLATDRDARRSSGALLPGVDLLPLQQALAGADAVHVAIGDARGREREATLIGPARLATVVHPRASVSADALLGAGCFIGAQAVLAPCAQLGVGVIVNHGAVVDHDARVGDFSHLAPQSAVGGGVTLGRRVLLGAGAAVLPNLAVGDDVVIGAGAVVRDSLAEPGVYVGVPARRVK